MSASSGSGWGLVFQGISTLSIVTLAGLAIYRETKHEGSLLGRRGAELGMPAPAHRRRAAQLRTAARDVRRSFDAALAAGRCDHALEQLVAVSKYEGAIAAHQGRDGDPPGRFDALSRYASRCR